MTDEQPISTEHPSHLRRRWLNWLDGAIGLGLIAVLAWRLDCRQFTDALQSARLEFVRTTFMAITLDQVLRAQKWRQILSPLREDRTSHLFGATMAGQLPNLLVPLGLSPFVRFQLVARVQRVLMSSVLTAVAIDRLVDGLAFAGTVVLVALAATFPDPNRDVGLGLLLGAGGSAAAIVAVLLIFVRHKRRSAAGIVFVLGLANHLPGNFAVRARSLVPDTACRPQHQQCSSRPEATADIQALQPVQQETVEPPAATDVRESEITTRSRGKERGCFQQFPPVRRATRGYHWQR